MIALDDTLRTCQDVVMLSAIASGVVWMAKLLRPSSDLDRLSSLASWLALSATVCAAALGLFESQAIVPWALVLLGPQMVTQGLSFEFGSRLWGLLSAMVALGVLALLGSHPLVELQIPVDWTVFGRLGAWCAAGFLFAAAAAVPIQGIFGSPRTTTSRRTLRTLAASWGGLAEVGFRMVAWSLPFLGVTVSTGCFHPALVLASPTRWVPALVLTLSAITHLVVSRRLSDDPEHHPVWLVAMAVLALVWIVRWV